MTAAVSCACPPQFERSHDTSVAPLQDRDAASRWSVATATAAATLGASGAGGAATLQDVCTCAHAEAGLRAAMRSCAGQVESREGDLVQALTLQARVPGTGTTEVVRP